MNRSMVRARFVAVVILAVAILTVASSVSSAVAADKPTSQWVYPGSDGKLVYKTTPTGDKIMDFSHAGYMGGGVALPNVPVKRTLQPSGGEDDAAVIQAAIAEVSTLPLENGFRGAVLLAPGIYNCPTTLSISASGVVLRGSGSGANGSEKTTLKLTGRPHSAIAIRGPGGGRGRGQGAQPPAAEASPDSKPAATTVSDAYVPSGAISFNVADATSFAVGDTISIRKPVTEAWVKFMHMHDLVRDGRPQTWIRSGTLINTERAIAAISGNKITVDIPLADSYDAEYLNPTGTAVVKITPPTRITQSGVEYLHIESPPQPFNHTQPHFTAMRVNGKDLWVRDVVADETMNSTSIGGTRITFERVAINRKARHEGSSKPAEIAPNGGQVLLDRCSSIGDNVWYIATGGLQAGPVVALNCTFTGNGRAESHQRWSTGMLYDNCRAPGGGLDFRNRGSMGSGHGWSMGWGVAWNCEAESFVIQHPPGAANWMIGCVGKSDPKPRPFGTEPNLPVGIIDSPGVHVTPQSLYLAQLAERLGPQAVKNIGY